MSKTLLVDFGASRIKSVLWSKDENKMIDGVEIPSPKPSFGSKGEVEVDPNTYWSALENTAGRLLERHSKVEDLWLCTEMHGILVANSSGDPITPYISWRDGRGSFVGENNLCTLDVLNDHSETFFSHSGMNFRAGLPIVTLSDLSRQQILPYDIRIFTLADWLLWKGGDRDPAVHPSLAAGTGFFDINSMQWSEELLEISNLDAHRTKLGRVADLNEHYIGNIKLGDVPINVFGGIGDLQASVHGTGFPKRTGLVVNLGTGSQVVGRLGMGGNNRLEKRVSVCGEQFNAVTHIPSGRALNVFSAFVDECSHIGKGKPVFWELFKNLSPEKILSEDLEVNLNLFPSAMNHIDGGSIQFIRETGFSVECFVAGLAKSWLSQYAEAMKLLDPRKQENEFLVVGGLSQRAGFILPVISELAKRKGQMGRTRTGEITLDGLLALSKVSNE